MIADEELRQNYLSTVTEIDIDGRTVTEPEAVELLGQCWVITAWNPYSQLLDPATNAHRHTALIDAIDALGAVRWGARGTSPDGRWSEESLAITGLDFEEVRDLANRFEQHAVFELRSGARTVRGCSSDWTVERVLGLNVGGEGVQ